MKAAVDILEERISSAMKAVAGGKDCAAIVRPATDAKFGDYQAREIIDVKGDFLCPGLIDGHVHIESSMVTIPEFARAVLPNGTTTAVIDPHEIANVLGLEGIRFMAESAKILNPDKTVLLPSDKAGCSLAESITPQDVKKLREQYPGVRLPAASGCSRTGGVRERSRPRRPAWASMSPSMSSNPFQTM